MSRPQSRAPRKAAFMAEAERLYEALEDRYDKSPQASFGEIEAEARKRRRVLRGKALEQWVKGGDTGRQVEAPKCAPCGEAMEFERYCGEYMACMARADWKGRITPVRTAKGRRFFPLDQKLNLRADHWSEGAARLATRQGLQSKSFDKAAELYSDSTGGDISSDSLRRIREGTSQAQQSTQRQVDCLWHGRVEEVVTAWQVLPWDQVACVEAIRTSPSCFETRKQHMDYARLRQEGYPIGSGTVESGSNTVLHHRMNGRDGAGNVTMHKP